MGVPLPPRLQQMIKVRQSGSADTSPPAVMSRTIGISVAATGMLSTIELATAEKTLIGGNSSLTLMYLYLAGAWDLFLASKFDGETWTIVLSQPEDYILSSLGAFQRNLTLVVILGLMIVLTWLLKREYWKDVH